MARPGLPDGGNSRDGEPPLGAVRKRKIRPSRDAAAAIHEQSRQLYRIAGQYVSLAGRAGRRSGGDGLPRLSRRRSAVRRQGCSDRYRHAGHGHRRGWQPQGRLPAGHGNPCEIHPLRRRGAWQSDQADEGEIRPRGRLRTAGLRSRRQGIVGHRSGQARARPRDPYARLAAERNRHLGRGLPLSPGQRSGGARLRDRARLRQSLCVALSGIPALEAPSGHCRDPRRWQARVLWRARDQRRRLAIRAQAGIPRRRADRLFGRFRERPAHQGQPHRDEERDAGRGEHRCGDRRR